MTPVIQTPLTFKSCLSHTDYVRTLLYDQVKTVNFLKKQLLVFIILSISPQIVSSVLTLDFFDYHQFYSFMTSKKMLLMYISRDTIFPEDQLFCISGILVCCLIIILIHIIIKWFYDLFSDSHSRCKYKLQLGFKYIRKGPGSDTYLYGLGLVN